MGRRLVLELDGFVSMGRKNDSPAYQHKVVPVKGPGLHGIRLSTHSLEILYNMARKLASEASLLDLPDATEERSYPWPFRGPSPVCSRQTSFAQ